MSYARQAPTRLTELQVAALRTCLDNERDVGWAAVETTGRALTAEDRRYRRYPGVVVGGLARWGLVRRLPNEKLLGAKRRDKPLTAYGITELGRNYLARLEAGGA